MLMGVPGAKTSVDIPNGVVEICDTAFYGCENLTSVTIPNSVEHIGVEAFYGCTSLTSVTIPASVTEMGEATFAECTALKTVTFEGEPPALGEYVDEEWWWAPFENTTAAGYYPSSEAAAWEAVIDTDGKWAGLTMEVYTAEVEPATYAVTVTVVGEGAVTGAGTYAVGADVTLVATATEGSVFCGRAELSGGATLTFTMPEGEKTVTAYFASATAVQRYVATQYPASTEYKEAVDAAVDAEIKNRELYTKDQMKSLALGAPGIEGKEGEAKVGIAVMKANALDDEWTEADKVEAVIALGDDENAAFYKFVVPSDEAEATE